MLAVFEGKTILKKLFSAFDETFRYWLLKLCTLLNKTEGRQHLIQGCQLWENRIHVEERQ